MLLDEMVPIITRIDLHFIFPFTIGLSIMCVYFYHQILQTCFFRQFGRTVVRADYLTLRKGFIMVWIQSWTTSLQFASCILKELISCKTLRKIFECF